MTTIFHLHQWKKKKRKFASITVYDASFARLFFKEGINVMLVGDSLGMTIQGKCSTLSVTIADLVYHTRCVRYGAPSSLLLSDLPFMSYATLIQAYENAAALIRAGANIVKLEGGSWTANTISGLTEKGIPVCGHLGLTPQSLNMLGGYKVQGCNPIAADRILNDALLLEEAGAQLLILEYVPTDLAEQITRSLTIPVIGIGAGPATDGQILVMHDALGITGDSAPFFSKDFLSSNGSIASAIRLYIQEVENGIFPSVEHSFSPTRNICVNHRNITSST